jgi:hypothetical protein
MTAHDPESLSEFELGRRLRAAYGAAAGCPPPESWHRAALGELPPAERDRLAAHAAACPACAAERDLALAFAAGPGPGAAALDADVAAIVARLEARPPHRAAAGAGAPERPAAGGVATERWQERPAAGTGAAEPSHERPAAGAAVAEPPRVRPATGGARAARPAGRLLRFPRLAGAPAAALAAAAALALALGLGAYVLRAPQPPPLPDRPAGGAVRGAAVGGLAPSGELDAAPAAFTWDPVAGADRYRVTLLAADDAVLWQGEVAAPPAPLPAAVIPLSSAVVYQWRIEALDAGGRTVARSERASFRVRPEPEAAPPGTPGAEGER